MAEHRVPMLGDALRRRVDPTRSRDPRVRELVAALATLEIAPAPQADFKAELRAQLVAVTPRLVEEGRSDRTTPADTATAAKHANIAQRRPVHIKKPLIAVASVLTAFVLLLGGAVLLSQNALPGDALYGLKRASENTEYSLAGGAVDKGKLKLEFADRRFDEVADLLGSPAALGAGSGPVADATISANTTKLVRETLSSGYGDVSTAAKLLGRAAVASRSAGPLTDLTGWTPTEIAALNGIAARIPSGLALHRQAVQTRNHVLAAQQRAQALLADLGCSCLNTTRSDDLGPQPCTTGCSAPSTGSRPSGTPPGSTAPRPRTTAPQPGATTPAQSTAPAPAPAPTPGSSSGTRPPTARTTPPDGTSSTPTPGAPSSSPKPRISLPPLLPTPGGGGKSRPAPSLPVGVDSCGVHATLGPIGIGIGGC